MKYYFCEICGNLIKMIEDSGNVPVCCGKEMKPLSQAEIDRIEKVPEDECKCTCD